MATLNRVEMLKQCVTCALLQTRPPSEIVIVDASDDWQSNRDQIEALVGGSVPVRYLPAPVRSSTVQRNTGIRACSSDICMLIDDDSLMHADCAEVIMTIYEADQDEEILGIAGVEGPSPLTIPDVARKESSGSSGREREMTSSRFKALLWRELFLMSREANFIPYSGPVGSYVPEWAREQGLNLVPAIQLPGCRMTIRRSAGLKEPFEPAFLSYSPGEDFDISYRLSRTGAICIAKSARVYHHKVAASRIRREQELVLSICNVAYLLRRHSPNLSRDKKRWVILMVRRVLAEFLKDGLSRRWRFPQWRATFRAAALSQRILALPESADIAEQYAHIQRNILASK